MKGATMWVGVSCVTNFLDSIHCCGGGDSLPACCAQASERFSLFSGGSLAASASAFPLSPSYSVTLLIIPIPSLFSHRKKGRKEQERWENAAASCTATRPDRSAPEIITATHKNKQGEGIDVVLA